MRELLRCAWVGWRTLSDAGKLSTVLFLMFLLVWIWKLGNEKQKELFGYGGLMTALCIFPVSAVLFMLWQTNFYDYEWIWTAVPVLEVIACGGVLAWDHLWKSVDEKKRKMIFAGMAIAILFLCGNLGNPNRNVEDVSATRREVADVLDELEKTSKGSICLWAPKEVMANARSLDGNVTLIYGRNMWQKHLNAFSYEEYSQDQRDLYVWMSLVVSSDKLNVTVPTGLDVVGAAPRAGETLEGIPSIRKALAMGVNQILLPGILPEEFLSELEQEFLIKPEKVGQYWLLSFE